MTLDVLIALPTQSLWKGWLSKADMSTFWASLCAGCRADSVNVNISRKFQDERAWDIAGSVLEHWNERLIHAVDAIFRLHRKEILKGRAWDGSIDCWMVGRFKECTTPTVVLSCMDRGAVKRLMKRVSKDKTFQESGFGVLGRPGCLKFVGGDSDGLRNSPGEMPTVDACGLPVTVDFGAASHRIQRTATIGGVVIVEDNFYYLTAAHPFATTEEDLLVGRGWLCKEEPWDHPWSPVMIEDLDSEGEEYDSDDTENTSRSGQTTSMSEGSGPDGLKIFPAYAWVSTFPPSNSLGQPSEATKLVASIHPERLARFRFDPVVSLNQDWALLWPEIVPVSLINRFEFEGKILDITDTRKINGDCRPLLLSQKYSEPFTINCSEAASLIPLPGGDRMTIAHKVYHLAESGDSGSWIVDGKSGNLLGILVSSSVEDEISYMLPVEAVFNSILKSSKSSSENSGPPTVALPPSNLLSSTHTVTRLLKQALGSYQRVIVRRLLRDMDLTVIKGEDDIPLDKLVEIASEDGNDSAIQALIDAGAAASQSALQTACRRGHDEVVKILLKARANATTGEALLLASEAGHERVVQLLVQAGADANSAVLEKACAKGHDKVVKILLEAGADLTDFSLSDASRAGHERVVQLLLPKASAIASRYVKYAFNQAVENGHEGTVAVFLQADVDVDAWGVEALCIAVRKEYLNIVKLLIDAGVDVQGTRRQLIEDGFAGGEKRIERLLLAAEHQGSEKADKALETDEIADDERQLAAFSDPEL